MPPRRSLGATWNHASFEAQRTRIEQQLVSGRFREALDGAKQLLQRARGRVKRPIQSADYDLAVACLLLARALKDCRCIRTGLAALGRGAETI